MLPTLPMFLLFPLLMQRTGFWIALGICALVTMLLFALQALILRQFGIHLL